MKKEIQPTAMMDISDGLSSELIHICRQSETGCRIYDDKIPFRQDTVKAADEMNIEPLMAALNGGEDYELLFTITPDDYKKIKDQEGISFIGHITDKSKGMYLTPQNGEDIQLKAQGWTAYKAE
jgi:thiamine-monophosphate kinase